MTGSLVTISLPFDDLQRIAGYVLEISEQVGSDESHRLAQLLSDIVIEVQNRSMEPDGGVA